MSNTDLLRLLSSPLIALLAMAVTSTSFTVNDVRSGAGNTIGGVPNAKRSDSRIVSKRLVFLAQPSVRHTVYVALGDSLTFGRGADDPATQSYPAVLAHHLPSGSRFMNLGINGYTLGDVFQFVLSMALRSHPTLVTIWLVGNDVRESPPTALSTYRKELKRLLNSFSRTHARVFVANAFDPRVVPSLSPPMGGNLKLEVVRRFNQVIASVATQYHDPVIDIFGASKAIWGHHQFVQPDGFHLTPRGYATVAQVFYVVMHRHGAL